MERREGKGREALLLFNLTNYGLEMRFIIRSGLLADACICQQWLIGRCMHLPISHCWQMHKLNQTSPQSAKPNQSVLNGIIWEQRNCVLFFYFRYFSDILILLMGKLLLLGNLQCPNGSFPKHVLCGIYNINIASFLIPHHTNKTK